MWQMQLIVFCVRVEFMRIECIFSLNAILAAEFGATCRLIGVGMVQVICRYFLTMQEGVLVILFSWRF
jgi:hypothetical protein